METNLSTPKQEERPWGTRLEFSRNSPSTVVLLEVRKGEALSLQFHRDRSEQWKILSGSGFVTIGKDRLPAKTGDYFSAPAGTPHRIEGGTDSGITVLEISTGMYDDNDITRTEDKYGRTTPHS